MGTQRGGVGGSTNCRHVEQNGIIPHPDARGEGNGFRYNLKKENVEKQEINSPDRKGKRGRVGLESPGGQHRPKFR